MNFYFHFCYLKKSLSTDELERARKKSCEVDSEEEQLAQAIALSLTDPGKQGLDFQDPG